MGSGIARAGAYTLGLIMIVSWMGRDLLATIPSPAPEIDGSSVSAGLGLLAGGILILRSRRRSK